MLDHFKPRALLRHAAWEVLWSSHCCALLLHFCISIYFELLAAWSDGFANRPDPTVLAFPGRSIARVDWVSMLHCCMPKKIWHTNLTGKRTMPCIPLVPPEAMGPNLCLSAKRRFSIKAACFVDHLGSSIMFNLWFATSARWSHQAPKRLRHMTWICLRC